MGVEVEDRSSDLIQQVLKENRKLILDNLKDVLTTADTIFEQGYLTREDYHEIDAIEDPVGRSSAFVDILATKDNIVLDVLIEYLGHQKDGNSLLCEKLKFSKDKFSPRDKVENSIDLKLAGGPIDSTDFTMTLKGLQEVSKVVKKSTKALNIWETVLSNMNGLDDFDIHSLKELISNSKNPFEEDDSSVWNEIIKHTFNLWKERNGPNATFFSLIGIFQESRLIEIADALLDKKDEIQKAPLKNE